MTIAIKLTQGKIALVDDLDADLAALRWCAQKRRNVYYAVRNVRKPDGNRGLEQLHRVIAARLGIFGIVDHENRDGLDCTRQNLRLATPQQNAANARVAASNTSGFKGVSWNTNEQCWEAYIKINGRQRRLGRFDDLGTAGAVAAAARQIAFGDFGKLA